jgi:hypothetical protein
MGVIIGQTDPLTGDFYTTWAKLRSPILGQRDTGGIAYPGSFTNHSYQYPAGEGFTTSYGSPLRFDMRYDSTTWPVGFWRPTIFFNDRLSPTPGWYVELVFRDGNVTVEDEAELTGETVVGTVGSFVISSDFFDNGQYLGPLTSPQPVEQPILSVGKLTPF